MEKYNVNNLIFSSSACVYSDKNVAPFHEDDVLNPINPYGRTKYFIEEIIKDYAKANNTPDQSHHRHHPIAPQNKAHYFR